MKTRILLIKNSPGVIEYLLSKHKYELYPPGLDRNTYKYLAMPYGSRWYKFKTYSAESQYLPEHRLIGDLSTLHQIDILKSLGLKDQEIWNQLKESN